MKYYFPYCFWQVSSAVDAPSDAGTVVGVPIVAGISAAAFLPSAVYVCDAPFVFAAVHPTVPKVCEFLLLLLSLMLPCCWRPCCLLLGFYCC